PRCGFGQRHRDSAVRVQRHECAAVPVPADRWRLHPGEQPEQSGRGRRRQRCVHCGQRGSAAVGLRRWRESAVATGFGRWGVTPAAATPAPFYWGVAMSGYQSEGSAPDSNWRRYEQSKTTSIKEPYRNSVDFRHRYAEDIARAKQLGVTVFRFSVEWARIEP